MSLLIILMVIQFPGAVPVLSYQLLYRDAERFWIHLCMTLYVERDSGSELQLCNGVQLYRQTFTYFQL